jgi:hypothetical protein
MVVALSPELPDDAIEHLIVTDIAPSSAELSTDFQGYIEAMNKIEQSGVSSRREAQDILTPYEPVCHLLLYRLLLLGRWAFLSLGFDNPRVSPD